MGRSRNAELEQSWQNTCQLYRHLTDGGELLPLASGLHLDADESVYADSAVDVASYFAYDQAETAQMLGPYLHTRNLKREIRDLMTPRWREHRTLRGVITNQRLLVSDQTWESLWHEDLVELTGDALEWSFVLEYEGVPPLMLFGPSSTFFAIMIGWLTYGTRGLDLPAFAPVAAAVGEVIQQPPP